MYWVLLSGFSRSLNLPTFAYLFLNPESPDPRPASVAVWMTVSIAVFALLGSLALMLAFQHQADREERLSFEAQAEANTAFLDRTPLPQSEQMAAQLGEVMGAHVFFWHSAASTLVGRSGDKVDARLLAMPVDGSVHVMPNGEWVVGRPYRGGSRVYFLRLPPERHIALNRADTWGTLAAFWLLSLALGIWLARRVTRPLRTLAEALPQVGTDHPLPPIPTARRDEIGQLAQALARTHDTLRDERERRRAAERHALLGRMATSLAHEVRNPVSAIRLHAQLLEGAPPQEAAASRKLIESEAARIESLVSQWMRYAKPSAPVLADVDLSDLIRHAIGIMTPQAQHARVTLQFNHPGPATIQADRQRLLQVLTNVLLNAIQAMPHGGMVQVALEHSQADVRLIITDAGAGFSTTALARLGEPFYSEKEGGMGLGLTVSREICEAHGGTLSVAPANGVAGASVVISLPSVHPVPPLSS